jgi:capsular polysaccharide biosynthesis protein
MELKEYIKIIRNEKEIIAKITVLTALFAFVFSVLMPVSYETSVSLFINKNSTQQTDQFKYDGYYALESGEIVSDNVEKMLQSPEVVDAIYQKSGIDPSFKNIKSYKKRFTAHKMSNQYVEVSFTAPKKDDAEKIAAALTETVNQKISSASAASGQEVSFSVDNNQPVTLEKKQDLLLNTFIGLVSGLFLGIFAAFLKKYRS